jgi:hypothetical protein
MMALFTMMAFWLAAILLVTYSIALILVGHGAAPLALLLVWGDPADMLPGQVLSWASIVGLVFVTIWFRHDPLKLAIWQLTASIFLYLSWFVFAYLAVEPSVLWSSSHRVGSISGGIRGRCRDTHPTNRATAQRAPSCLELVRLSRTRCHERR